MTTIVGVTGRRIRQPLGFDCLVCGYARPNGTRDEAKQHALDFPGHNVHYTVEETTVYRSKETLA